MIQMIKLIEQEQEKLVDCEFLQWLGNSNISAEERLAFTPSMLFFIMGFKDLLTSIKIDSPSDKLEHLITTHCEEDLGHWKWYISDLKSLGFAGWGEDLMQFSSQLWSDETKQARDLIYKSFNYHYTRPSLVTDLVLIEIMEATFGAFTGSMEKCVKEAGRFNDLKFFGEVHHHAEANHSTGNWIEEDSVEDAVLSFKLNETEQLFATGMILDLFKSFNEMFSMWYESRAFYTNIKNIPMVATEITHTHN